METWKTISGYEGRYQVSTLGNVRSVDYVTRANYGGYLERRQRKIPGKMLIPQLVNNKGTFRVGLRFDSTQHRRSVHELVLETFIGPCPPNGRACHINGNKHDNRLENLCWEDKGPPTDWVRKYVRSRPKPTLNRVKVRAIRKCSLDDLETSLRFGVTLQTVKDIRSGKLRADIK